MRLTPHFLGAAALALTGLWAAPAHAQLSIPYTTQQLDNGMQVLLSQDNSTPVVAVSVYVKVGSSDEVKGRTGFAHLFEHMMFQGSEHVGKAEHFQYVNRNGGKVNGTTNADRTNYFEVLPSHELELALWLEADRFRSLKVTDENFENQRQAVKEERRLRIDNRPYVPAMLRVNELAYENFAYGHDTIGSMADLDAAKTSDVKAFFDKWYAASNLVLVIAGDFEPEAAMQLVKKYFGRLPKQPAPERVAIEEPPQSKERYELMYDPHAKLPAFIEAYHVPPKPHPDHYALEVAARLLSGGKSSRLYKSLVKEKQVAVQVAADLDNRRGPDLFNLWGILRGKPDEVRRLVYAEVTKLMNEGPGADELKKVKVQARAEYIRSMESALHRALTLGKAAAVYGDPSLVNSEVEALSKVTGEQVQAALKKYLVPTNKTTLDVLPEAMREAHEKEKAAAPVAAPERGKQG